ncbi:MAG: STAS domain-containing protein [Firmicutes bacterium]|nr:STAS domain-containing protein [Bacillota bacterium]
MIIVLPEELTIFTVNDFRDKTIKRMSNRKLKGLDAADLRELDGAGIQLLLSLYKSFPYLTMENLSDALLKKLELIGLKEIFISKGSVNNG